MRGGKLSVRMPPILVFNLDNLLYEKAEGNFFHKIFSKPKINSNFVRRLNMLFSSFYFTIFLMTEQDVEEMEKFLEKSIPVFYYSKIVPKASAEELQRLLQLEYTYYIDNDEKFLATINSNGAIHFNDLGKYV